MAYPGVDWQNKPSTASPINRTNLEIMDNGIIEADVNATSAKTEVEGIRTGADGVTYSSAGEAVRNQIGNLKSALSESNNRFDFQKPYFDKVYGINLCDPTKVTVGKIINADGSVSDNASYSITGIVRIDGAEYISIYRCKNDTLVPQTGYYRAVFYDALMQQISVSSNTGTQLANSAISVPDGAEYVIGCFGLTSGKFMIIKGQDFVNFVPYTESDPTKISDEISELKSVINFEPITGVNKLDNTKIINGYYNASGVFVSNDGFRTVSEPIYIGDASGTLNTYSCLDTGKPKQGFYSLIFFDADMEFMSSASIINSSTGLANSVQTIPDNAVYVIPSFVLYANNIYYMMSYLSDTIKYHVFTSKSVKSLRSTQITMDRLSPEKWVGKKVLVIGDSISDNSYHEASVAEWSKWPYQLAYKLGFNLVNMAHSASGFISASGSATPSEYSWCNRVDTIVDNDYDMIIIFLGINDYITRVPLGTEPTEVKTSDFVSAVDYVLNYLTTNQYKARIVGVLPMPIYDGYNSVIQGYIDKLIEEYNKYDIPYYDAFHHSGFRGWQENFKNQFTQLALNNQHDGLHPNEEWDNKYLTPIMEQFIDRFI